MAIEDDDKPRKKISHEIGQDLSLLSVEELTERIKQFFQGVSFRTGPSSRRTAGTHTPRSVL